MSKKKGSTFYSGGIVRYMGRLWIVKETKRANDEHLSLLAADYGNVLSGVSETPYQTRCDCDYNDCGDYVGANPECENCHGAGRYVYPGSTMDDVEYVAGSMMEFIEERMMGLFK